MIHPLWMGTFAFVLMAGSDACRLRGRDGWGGVMFLGGCGLLCTATFRLLLRSQWEYLSWNCLFFLGLAFLSLPVLVYSVFFAVKPNQADLQACPPGKQPLVSHGMYALCRHPGVLWLGAFYGFLALAWFSRQWLLAFILFTGGDILYVFYQDRWIFPHTIDRYREYQRRTPFLIPTPSSIREAFTVKAPHSQ